MKFSAFSKLIALLSLTAGTALAYGPARLEAPPGAVILRPFEVWMPNDWVTFAACHATGQDLRSTRDSNITQGPTR